MILIAIHTLHPLIGVSHPPPFPNVCPSQGHKEVIDLQEALLQVGFDELLWITSSCGIDVC